MFFLSFPCCRGEASHSLLRCNTAFVIFSIALCCFHFSASSATRLSLFRQSSLLSCGLPHFLQPPCFFVSAHFGNISPFILSMCPTYFIHLLAILSTMQASVPISYLSLRSFIPILSTINYSFHLSDSYLSVPLLDSCNFTLCTTAEYIDTAAFISPTKYAIDSSAMYSHYFLTFVFFLDTSLCKDGLYLCHPILSVMWYFFIALSLNLFLCQSLPYRNIWLCVGYAVNICL